MRHDLRLISSVITSVFLSFVLSLSFGQALESDDSDQTKPEDSIKVEEPDEIQVDNQAGNQSNQPSGEKPDLESAKVGETYKVKVHFSTFQVIVNKEFDNSRRDYFQDGNEYYIYAYVQGKKLELYKPVNLDLGLGHVRIANTYGINKDITVDIPKNLPLSIMTVAYEQDGCPDYNYPNDIQKKISQSLVPLEGLSGLGGFGNLLPIDKYPGLKEIRKQLYTLINADCVQDNDPHEALGYINKVYGPPTYGAGVHNNVDAGGLREYADFRLSYSIAVTPPLQADTLEK